MVKLLTVLAVLVSTTYVHLQEEVDYRLPTVVLPSHYELSFTFSRTVFVGERLTFDARVDITISASESVSEIKLHLNPNYIRIKTVSFIEASMLVNDYATNEVTEILTITTRTALTPGTKYTLSISYEADISTSDMFGVYRSSYQDAAGAIKYLVATQFQATFARRAFPCFDEPSFKATFKVSFILAPNATPMSNTKQESFNPITPNILQYTFTTTPVMSTYLFAFIVSELDCTEGALVDKVQNKICSRPAAVELRSWAVEMAPKLLQSLNEYTQVNYNETLDKFDYVAVPDFSVGAMENWGLSTYREQYILYNPQESTNSDKQEVATLLAHEIAHQWFGNLVTCNWWSETFLNEGFGDYFEYLAVHMVLPEWQLDSQYVVNHVQSVLRVDDGSLPALQTSVSPPEEILSMFNLISYSKGGSILRMVEHIMGTENFRKGINEYLTTNKHGNTLPENLWESLQLHLDNLVSNLPPDTSLNKVMDNWIKEPGFPLLTVTVKGKDVIIEQGDTSNSSTEWYVPISYTTSVDTTPQTTTPQYWLVPNSSVVFELPENNEWIVLNNQQTGYYRINYDLNSWNAIASALKQENFSGISEIHRAQIVDDLFNLARIGELSYSRIFELLDFLVEDVSYFTWISAFNGFGFLLERLGTNSTLSKNISNHTLTLMSKLYESTPFDTLDDSNHIYTLKQVLTLKWACQLGHLECVGMSRGLFLTYKLNGVRPPKNLRSTVYCTALQKSTNKEDWDFLYQDYLDSDLDSERILLLKSLACTTDKVILDEFLQRTLLDTSQIRPQDRLIVFENVATNPQGSDIAINFFIDRYTEISQKYQSLNPMVLILQVLAAAITNQEQLDKFQTFVDGGQFDAKYIKEGKMAFETAQRNLNWLSHYEEEVRAYYYPPEPVPVPVISSAISTNINNMFPCVTFIVLYLFCNFN